MAELAMLADIQQTVYPQEVTRQQHVMAQFDILITVLHHQAHGSSQIQFLTATSLCHLFKRSML